LAAIEQWAVAIASTLDSLQVYDGFGSPFTPSHAPAHTGHLAFAGYPECGFCRIGSTDFPAPRLKYAATYSLRLWSGFAPFVATLSQSSLSSSA
jgi:hypothetical protein